jgi:hypothetical protein
LKGGDKQMLRTVLFILFAILFYKYPHLAGLFMFIMNSDKMSDSIVKRFDDWEKVKKSLQSLILWVKKAPFYAKSSKQDKSVTENNSLDVANMILSAVLVTVVTMYLTVRHIIG